MLESVIGGGLSQSMTECISDYLWKRYTFEAGEEKRIQKKPFLVLLANVVYTGSKNRDRSLEHWPHLGCYCEL